MVKIGPLTAEILLTLSLGGWVGGGGVKSFLCKTQTYVRLGYVGLWLGWGFDNFKMIVDILRQI